jgi:hypothetical protein
MRLQANMAVAGILRTSLMLVIDVDVPPTF